MNVQAATSMAHRALNLHNQSLSQPPRQGSIVRERSLAEVDGRNETVPIVATGGTGEAAYGNYSSAEEEEDQVHQPH